MKRKDIEVVMMAETELKEKEYCLKCGSKLFKPKKGLSDNFCCQGCQRLILLEYVIKREYQTHDEI